MMNFRLYTVILITIISVSLFSCSSKKEPYFEGIIEYHNTFIPKNNSIDSIALRVIFGQNATLYFKEGNFFEKYNDGIMLEQFYLKQTNKTYIKKNNSDTLYWFDCQQKGEPILKYQININKEEILGVMCDELVTYYKEKTISIYYNTDSLPINPKWYNKFTYSNKNFVTKQMKSMYLKYKIEYPDFIAIVTATSISKQKVDPRTFEISKKKILIKDKN